MRRRISIVAMLGLLAVAPAALATGVIGQSSAGTGTIVPGQSIDGVKLGDTEAQVEQVLGRPEGQEASGSESLLGYEKGSPFDGVVALNAQGKVIDLQTNTSRFKTGKGIHVGSPLKAVHKAYPQAKKGATPLGPEYTLKSSYDGQPVVTFFYTEPQRYGGHGVAQIEIGLQSAVG
jgi:hypothetical protein